VGRRGARLEDGALPETQAPPEIGATLVTAANGSGDPRVVRLIIPAKPEYITLGRLALTGLSRLRPLADETLADLKLALTEACSNSVRHAYDGGEGLVDILFELHADRLVIEVADDGQGFDPSLERGAEALAEGGLGIAIIRAVADELEIGARPSGQGSRLRFAKALTA
jgi:serine/threonine-protein kinase RsbW